MFMEPQRFSVAAAISNLQEYLERNEAEEADRKGIKVFLRSLNLIQQVIGNFLHILSRMLAFKDFKFKIITPLLCEEWIGRKQ